MKIKRSVGGRHAAGSGLLKNQIAGRLKISG
jgi:hypothetical protein